MTFFSVDVETTSTNPFIGSLLTVGVVAVKEFEGNWGTAETFYMRIKDSFILSDAYTMKWWSEQDDEVRMEAFGIGDDRQNTISSAIKMSEWVRSVEPDYNQSFFVANPVAFDKPWIDKLYGEADITNPFHYRSLCLRSMKYGLVSDPTFGSDRTTHESKLPHHALWDAEAQAYDLIDMLREKAIRHASIS